MKTKNRLSRLILLFTTVLFIITSCSSSEKKQVLPNDKTSIQTPLQGEEVPDFVAENGDTIWVEADQMPVYPGGDFALLKFIKDNVVYPEIAKQNGIEGRVIVRFCVNNHGYVDHVSVLKKVSLELDEESTRVVSALPQFEKAGIKNGKPVSVWYVVPVQFSLK
jgi:protein TonB